MARIVEQLERVTGLARADAILAVGGASAVGLVAALLATNLSASAAANAAIHPVAMAIILSLAVLPLIRWAVDGDRTLYRIIVGGLAAKALGMYLRFTLTGSGDNQAYHQAGTKVAGWLSESITGPTDLPERFGDAGTDWLSYMIGWLYYFTGPRRLTAFVVFTFIGFVGTLLFYRAAVSALPELDKRRYALLLFYMPSMLFWPSTIGKEAWMIGFLGLASIGVSGLVRHRLSPIYLAALMAGLLIAGRVRPHIATLVLISLIAAIIWPTRGQGSRGRQVVAVLVGLALLSVAAGQVAEFFRADRLELNPILDFAQGRTSAGGSQFSPLRITGPINFVPGAVSVLFRPFIFEATSAFQLLGGLESMALIVLGVFSHRRLRRVPRLFLQNGYVRFAVIYTIGFVVAFSVISNFGILTRQRAQLWPVFLIFLALSPKPESVEEMVDDQPLTVASDAAT